jgi:hypothetical protein
MKKIILAAVMAFGISTPVFAGSCPSIMAKIDEAMKTATVDEATKTKIMELYKKGKEEHEGGMHAESVASLNEAAKLLGM